MENIKDFNIDIIKNMVNDMNIDTTINHKAINKELNKLYDELEKFHYNLSIDDILELIKMPVFRVMLEGYYKDKNIKKLECFSPHFEVIFEIYKDIKTPKFSKEEIELFELVKKGDRNALEKLVIKNMPLVKYYANHYLDFGLSFDDLFQVGVIGLICAIEKFDVSKNVKLSTYASYYIKQEMIRALNDNRLIRLPLNVASKIRKIKTQENKLAFKLEHEPTIYELADYLNISVSELEKLKMVSEKFGSLNCQYFVDGEETMLLNTICDENIEIETEAINNVELANLLENLKNILTKKEFQVIVLRYGLVLDEEKTAQEIASLLNITKQRTYELERHALWKIKKMLVTKQYFDEEIAKSI